MNVNKKKRSRPAGEAPSAAPMTPADLRPQAGLLRDRVKELRRVRAADIEGAPWNWRFHPQSQVDALAASVEELGFFDPLDTRELPGGRLQLIDGHARRDLIDSRIGPDTLVPCVVTDFTEEEAKKANLLKDPLAAMAEADKGKLDALLREVQTGSESLAGMLTELAEKSGIVPKLPDPGQGGDDFDAVAAMEGECRVKPGDLWLIDGGKHRLLCGDSTKPEDVARVMAGEKAHMIHADPPYGVDFKRGQFITDPSRRSSRARGVGDTIAGDHRRADQQAEFIQHVFQVARDHCRQAASVYMWSATLQPGSHSMLGLTSAGVHIQSQLIWVKNNLVLGIADYHWKHEVCWYGWFEGATHRWFGDRNKTTILEFARVQSTEHPNEKPLALIEHLIGNSSLPDELVYDPFLGSGTSMVAAHRANRRCFGSEIEAKYCEVVLKRCEAEGLSVAKEE